MHSIHQVLEEKGYDIYAVPPSTSVYRAIEFMSAKGVGALLVMDGEHLVGIISERDYARKVILQGRSSRETNVAEIMTADVVTVDPHRSVDECLALITHRRIRHLPVIDGGRVIGVLSIGDLVRAKIADQESQIRNLENYISGN